MILLKRNSLTKIMNKILAESSGRAQMRKQAQGNHPSLLKYFPNLVKHKAGPFLVKIIGTMAECQPCVP